MMWLLTFIEISFFIYELTLGCRSYGHVPKKVDKKARLLNPNLKNWGGWNPPPGNDSWKMWYTIYGKTDDFANDSSEDSISGWPAYWKGLGQANRGVPPPPWAFIEKGYGKPQYCFITPVAGNCDKSLPRWGFNPTGNECEKYYYSGCGGNQNNFYNKEDCEAACVNVPSTGCDSQEKVNFEELIYDAPKIFKPSV